MQRTQLHAEGRSTLDASEAGLGEAATREAPLALRRPERADDAVPSKAGDVPAEPSVDQISITIRVKVERCSVLGFRV